MDKIVSIQNLTIEFNRKIEVVKNINLDVIKGKTTAIVGESGFRQNFICTKYFKATT